VLSRSHQLELVRLATLLTGDQQAAEDIVQDVFARVYPRWYTLTDRGSDPLPYIRASVVNGCRSAHRRRGVARRLGAAHEALARPPDVDSAEDAVLLSEHRREVLRALARLPGRQREALVLRYYLDLSEAEIAAAMGVSRGTVKSTISRGLAALARAIGEES
jgi:RNA polymerase sigma-70 factor (sigma-E family)